MRAVAALLLLGLLWNGNSLRADDLYGERSELTLGRLFLTEEERQTLDGRRALGPERDDAAEEQPSERAPTPKKSAAFGLIASGGRTPLIWRNGSFRQASDPSAAAQPTKSPVEKVSPDDESKE